MVITNLGLFGELNHIGGSFKATNQRVIEEVKEKDTIKKYLAKPFDPKSMNKVDGRGV